jgi:hypothetical protein
MPQPTPAAGGLAARANGGVPGTTFDLTFSILESFVETKTEAVVVP